MENKLSRRPNFLSRLWFRLPGDLRTLPPRLRQTGGGVRQALRPFLCAIPALLLIATTACAGEADLPIPDLKAGTFTLFGGEVSAWWLLFWGAMVITGTLGISLYLRTQIHKLPAHRSMLTV